MTQLSSLFVPYDIALMAKEKGFNDPCLTEYMPNPFNNKWILQPIKYTLLNSKTEQNNSQKGDFTGYKNSVPAPYGLKSVAAPIYQQLVDWFEKEHELLIRKSYNGVYWELIDLQTCTEGPTSNDINDLLKEAFKLIK